MINPFDNLAARIKTTPVATVDDTDIALIKLLAVDGRASQRSLAAAVGLSSPGVADRLARLSAKGIIRGYSVDINWEALGFTTVAHLSVLAKEGHDINAVIEQMLGILGVQEVSVVTGSMDLLVKVRVRGMEGLRRLLGEDLWSIDGVQRTETLIAVYTIEADEMAAEMIRSLASSDTPADGS